MFCIKCAGSGELLGNGMVTIKCTDCAGTGDFEDVEEIEPPKNVKIDKKSKAYVEAIHDIMRLNPDITRKEAAKLFKETYDKV